MAGIAGAILTQTTETVSLEVLGFPRSADILVMLILGGTGRLYGGLIGATIYMVARDQFSGVNPQYWYFPIGILLIAVVLFLPNGILGGNFVIGLGMAAPTILRFGDDEIREGAGAFDRRFRSGGRLGPDGRGGVESRCGGHDDSFG